VLPNSSDYFFLHNPMLQICGCEKLAQRSRAGPCDVSYRPSFFAGKETRVYSLHRCGLRRRRSPSPRSSGGEGPIFPIVVVPISRPVVVKVPPFLGSPAPSSFLPHRHVHGLLFFSIRFLDWDLSGGKTSSIIHFSFKAILLCRK
jgi:hypothetical protein